MTNDIGTGTANLSFNVPLDERAALGAAALKAGAKSVGEYLRKLMLLGAEQDNPELALRLRQVRQQYYGVAFLALFLAMLAFDGGHDLRRAGRTVRTVKTVRTLRSGKRIEEVA